MFPLSGPVRGPLLVSRQAGRGTGRPPVPSGAGGRPGRRRLMAGAAVLFAAVGGVLGGPAAPASAHAQLVGTTPANGARLDSAPSEVTLRFSERVNVVRDGIRLLDAAGAVRSTEPARLDPADPAQVRLPVPAGLGEGLYTVSWRVVSADSHPIHGAFVFGVGDVVVNQLPDVGARTDADVPLATAFWLFRWLGYAALALMAGGATFLLVCWPAGWAQARARRLLTAGWAASLGCTLAVLLLQGPYVGGGGLGDLADPALLAATVNSDFGEYVLARIALHLVCGVTLLRLARRAGTPARWRTAGPLLVALDIALPATWVGTGHANAEASLLAAAGDAAHIGAMAIWVGGLAVLVTCLLPDSAARPLTEMAAALPRFSRIATGAVAVIVGTGVYQAWRGVGSLSAVSGSTYGTLLVFKLAAVGVLLWLGALSRSAVRRRYLLRLPAETPADPQTALATPGGRPASSGPAGRRTGRRPGGTAVADRTGAASGRGTATARTTRRAARAEREQELLVRSRLRWSVRGEALIAVAILGLTSVLVATPPANRPEAAAPAPPPPGPVVTDLAFDGGTVRVRLEPASTGPTVLSLAVLDSAGAVWDVPEVSAAFLLPDRGLGPLPVTLRKITTGGYESDGLSLPAPGAWRLQIRVRTSDFEVEPVEAEVTVA